MRKFVCFAFVVVFAASGFLLSCSNGNRYQSSFKVIFDCKGGTYVNYQEVAEGGFVIRPKDPTKKDFFFAGWYNGDELYDFDTPVVSNIRLTAKWLVYAISYDIDVKSVEETILGMKEPCFFKARGDADSYLMHSVARAISDKSGIWVGLDLSAVTGITKLDSDTFRNCGKQLREIVLPNSLVSIGDRAFEDCTGLMSVTIPDSVISIGESAFFNCGGLTSVAIPDSVISIGESAFEYCSGLTSVTIPGSVTSIGRCAFEYCSDLANVTILDGVSSIGDKTFYDCGSLTSVAISDSMISIGESAFACCRALTRVVIPEKVISIGIAAFSNCDHLASAVFRDPKEWCFLRRESDCKDGSWRIDSKKIGYAKDAAYCLRWEYSRYYWYKNN